MPMAGAAPPALSRRGGRGPPVSGLPAATTVGVRSLPAGAGVKAPDEPRVMAFGEHWEWRGFGVLPAESRRELEALPLKFATSQRLRDDYLHVPGVRINVKLREGCLKFKRLLVTRGGLEHWLEDRSENFPLPLAPAAVKSLLGELGLGLSPPSAPISSERELIDYLRSGAPGLAVVSVEKERWQREWRGAGDRIPVTVEVAEIHAPERITSVGLEHPRAEAVTEALAALGVEPLLQRASYLEALGLWARGGKVAQSR